MWNFLGKKDNRTTAPQGRSADHLDIKEQSGNRDYKISAAPPDDISSQVATLEKKFMNGLEMNKILRNTAVGAFATLLITTVDMSSRASEKYKRLAELPQAPLLRELNPNLLTVLQRLAVYKTISPEAPELFNCALRWSEEIVRRRQEMIKSKSCRAEDMWVFVRWRDGIVSQVAMMKALCVREKRLSDFKEIDLILDALKRELQQEDYSYRRLTMTADATGELNF